MDVKNELDVYFFDGNEIGLLGKKKIVVSSHWIRDEIVIIEIDGHSYGVVAKQLRQAIDNATNWR